MLCAIAITLLLLCFRNLANRMAYSKKETMKQQGESPEGNAAALTVHPYIPWAPRGLLARVVANLEDGIMLAGAAEAVTRDKNQGEYHVYNVASQTAAARVYHVLLHVSCSEPMDELSAQTPVRSRA